MRRFLVMFRSHPTPPYDVTFADTYASCALSAIRDARRDIQLQHGWQFAQAIPWPRGCTDVDDAADRLSVACR